MPQILIAKQMLGSQFKKKCSFMKILCPWAKKERIKNWKYGRRERMVKEFFYEDTPCLIVLFLILFGLKS